MSSCKISIHYKIKAYYELLVTSLKLPRNSFCFPITLFTLHSHLTTYFLLSGGLCLISQVTKFIHTHVPDARLVEDVGCEVSYLIPPSSQRAGELQQLFKALDHSLDDLHISSYGISDTSLEEVGCCSRECVSLPQIPPLELE